MTMHDERLATLETQQAAQMDRCELISGQILNELQSIKTAVCGNGQKGLRREVDTLNLKMAFLLFIASAAFVGVCGLLARLAYGWLTAS